MTHIKTDILVIGGGPGGYTAAFHAAVKGKKVVLVEKEPRLGGVCLNCGCIPSKALLHAAETVLGAKEAEKFGVRFPEPSLDLDKLRAWKSGILEKLGRGITGLAGRRGVEIVRGEAVFQDARTVSAGGIVIGFDHAIIATGSVPAVPKAFRDGGPGVMTSTEALELRDIPGRLLVIGAGYIGMELGTAYAALGSRVTVVEALPAMLNGADADLVRYVEEPARKRFEKICLNARVVSLADAKDRVKAVIETDGKTLEEDFDRVLVSVGRVPFTGGLALERTAVRSDERGFIVTDPDKRTAEPSVFAIGDVTGGVMLAHKAAREARVAVDAICGGKAGASVPVIPAVVFTDPEVAWCGLTEAEARAKGIPVQIVKFPWTASGRAVTVDRPDGTTKLLIDPASERILGAGIAGKGAGELIGEAVLAVEKGMTAGELGSIVHAHPTLSETLMECAEMFYGQATHAFSRRRA
ncbi:MAG TPA: dihydrolipoyl dehydrogenase [Candidatus Omnitrophota bacterium]|jgi:dihydrolipoamide dehydrogenase|nr:dihydrolipoyl dehydrogenase [Candidatus Omnitrophota bacterium]